MLHQLIATICGITLHTQVNACRITLQQATVEYNATLNARADRLRARLEPHFRNEYTDKIFVVGKVVYERQIAINYGRFNITVRPNRSMVLWKWEF